MAASPLDGLYYAFSIPLTLFGLVLDAIAGNQNDPNMPQVHTQTGIREWFSQSRPGTDATTEVITVNFKLPLSISEVGFEALRVPAHLEVWYRDRQNNWRQVLDEARVPLALNLSASAAISWYKAHYFCWPVIAKAVQFRLTRVPDRVVGNRPYPVGLRNGLLRRNIYERSDGTLGIEPAQDPIGNTISHYIKDWDAPKAIDNNPTTFWRSAPMPDPMAVASLYLDCRTPDGGAQLVDTLDIDPIYTGQNLNLYYSNDDTVGTLRLSPIAAVADSDTNTGWQAGVGRFDSSIDPGTSLYRFPLANGPLVNQDTWIGIEWAPDFNPTSGPAANPVLFEVTPAAPDPSQYWPKIYYDVGAGAIVLKLTNGTLTQTYSAALSPLFTRYAPLRIVVGWTYGPNTVFISVKTQDGTELATTTATPSTLPALMTLDGEVSFSNFRGLFTAHVVKLENYALSRDSFQSNPNIYVSPDPVLPDAGGRVASTTLDNAIYAAAWTIQEHGSGGDHESRYENKTWTPIWRDYFSQKGKLFFPQQIRLKYLKCEFNNLTEEPYPVYDSGIQTSYRVFPVSVTQSVTQKHLGLLGVGAGLLTLGVDVVLSGVGAVNFLNPTTVNNAVNAIFGQTVNPVMVQSGAGTTITSLPNSTTLDVAGQTRQEVSSPWVYRRSLPSASTLAAQTLNTASSTTWGQTIVNGVSLVGGQILDSFTPAVQFAADVASLPVQGADFWVFPGATLRLPALVMEGLTAATEVVLGRAPTTETRLRFNTASVHRYDVKTVVRDAAVAYFAGVREIAPYVTTYISELDPPVFKFDSYDASQWVLTNTRALDTGPITTAGSLYEVVNPQFDQDISGWTQVSGAWSWDGSTLSGHFFRGAAVVSADGSQKELQSLPVDVAPGVHLNASVWVKWTGLTATASSQALALVARYYNNGVHVSDQTVGITNTTWPASSAYTQITATAPTNGFTVPSGVNQLRLSLVVTSAASAGTISFDTVELGTTDAVEGTAFKDFTTTSTFAKVKATFTDSGLVRSDSMWARLDPNDTNIDNFALAYYTSTIPDVIPAGMWADTFATWDDPTITWGAPRAVVAINVDPDRIFDGKRVLHFTRAGGAEEAGIKVRQQTNFVANGLFRIGAVFYKPTANGNQVTLRLRRMSDGVYIHEESFAPVVGYWYEYQSDFIEIPDSDDQIYTVELVLTGDAPDEFFLNDLYTEIALGRYFMRLGGMGEFLHDVTPLRYADSAIVSTTTPVQEMSVQVAVLSPKFFAYGVQLTPVYLK